MNPKISIIVPIYNVEKYLKQCIDSILAQTFKDFELILVNDGSPDNCGEICEKYAKNDNRVIVIHKKNNGVSSARNSGIEIAKGEYVGFVDPDDTVEKNMYERLIDTAITFNAEIVVSPITIINHKNNTNNVTPIWKNVNCIINNKEIVEEIIPSLIQNKTYSLVSSVNKLYKTSIFNDFNIIFDENKNHSEDARFNFTLLPLIKNLVFIEQPLYNYNIYPRDSLTQTFREDLYRDVLDNKIFMLNLCEKYNLENYIPEVKRHYTNVTLNYLQEIVKSTIPVNRKYEIISEVLNEKEFYEDIEEYKAPSIFINILKKICLKKNEKLLFKTIYYKIRIKKYSRKPS
ncbi:glycosyltransferase [Halalkalibacter alkaliphilus]|uniref:Glycosyltransferase n=1 Tax=Halalkalibacter alkaliphilus TaxID=2917993 RepID=A0A9X1ZZU4_9BACI|nr:glycosyltransferase [Halalkalibacter alkaliphilus]MCL7746080.1 glycosyltransferase [Halalkalibacter alkaliphilus]